MASSMAGRGLEAEWKIPNKHKQQSSHNHSMIKNGSNESCLPKNPICQLGLIAALFFFLAVHTPAQTLIVLHSFTGGRDGGYPERWDGLTLSCNTLYGVASSGGNNGSGTIFSIHKDGSCFTNLYSFTAASLNATNQYTNSDGQYPKVLVLSGNTLYGTTEFGGQFGIGTIFRINTDGTGFTNIYNFSGDRFAGGAGINIVVSSNTLYGTGGWVGDDRTFLFALSTDGTGFTNLNTFGVIPYDISGCTSGLILSSNTVYGAGLGGAYGYGSIFSINTDYTGYTNFYEFQGFDDNQIKGNDYPNSLLLSGNQFYGTVPGLNAPGNSGLGSVFAVNAADGTFTNLHAFAGSPSDGQGPSGKLLISGHRLYGVTGGPSVYGGGGANGTGTIFNINTDGTGYQILYNFTAGSSATNTNYDGVAPSAGFVLSGNTLYGLTSEGGSSGYGTLFSFTLPQPQLAIGVSGTNVILAWSTNFVGFALQSTTNLISPATWSAVSSPTAILNTSNVVTDALGETPTFYRLSQ